MICRCSAEPTAAVSISIFNAIKPAAVSRIANPDTPCGRITNSPELKLPAPEGEGLGVGSVISDICIIHLSRILITDPTPYPSPTMGGEHLGLRVITPSL